jgi:hypothetical protein
VAISVLDVRDTFVPPHVRVPARPAVETSPTTAPRRLPATVLAVGLIGVLEAVGLLAAALTGLDDVLSSTSRPAGWVVAIGLLLLAAWIVLCAGSGAAIIDGTGSRLLLAVAYAELVLVGALGVLGTVTPLSDGLPAALPLPALLLLAVAVPVGKLLLAGAPSAARWVAAGPRTRVRRPDPVADHRMLATVTLAVIGLALGALALLAPVQPGDAGTPASSVVFEG